MPEIVSQLQLIKQFRALWGMALTPLRWVAYVAPLLVTLGSTVGMLAADGLAVFLGHRFTDRVPMTLVNKIASGLFILFGIGIIMGY